MNINTIKTKLKSILSEKRYLHTMGVVETARTLANIYDVDENKIIIASLLHDCAKEIDNKTLINLISKYYKQDSIYLKNFIPVLHSYVGAIFASDIYEIKDIEILNAIKYHTTGRENMSLLEKIIYIADACEPNRNYPFVDTIRNLVKIDINKAIIFEINHKIIHLIDSNQPIHLDSIKMRNWLLKIVDRR